MFKSDKKASVNLTTSPAQFEHFSDVVFLPEDMALTKTKSRKEIGAEGDQFFQFEVRYPDDAPNGVMLAGDFNKWEAKPMKKG